MDIVPGGQRFASERRANRGQGITPVLRPASTSIKVVLPAPLVPMRLVSTPGLRQVRTPSVVTDVHPKSIKACLVILTCAAMQPGASCWLHAESAMHMNFPRTTACQRTAARRQHPSCQKKPGPNQSELHVMTSAPHHQGPTHMHVQSRPILSKDSFTVTHHGTQTPWSREHLHPKISEPCEHTTPPRKCSPIDSRPDMYITCTCCLRANDHLE